MARVLGLVPDLLFGSRLQAALRAGGHELELIPTAQRLRERLTDPQAPPAQALVVDLTDRELDGIAVLSSLADLAELDAMPTLAFYSHVEAAVREQALAGGFDLVVPRSRIAREGPALVSRLVGEGPALS